MKPGAATTSEGVLANFFNSLLSKKTGGVAGGQPGSLPGPATPPGAKMGGASSDDCEFNELLLGKFTHELIPIHYFFRLKIKQLEVQFECTSHICQTDSHSN